MSWLVISLLIVMGISTVWKKAAAADLYGKNLRPRAQTRVKTKINRYRTKSYSSEIKTDCNCDPGIYSVVFLTSTSPVPTSPSTDTVAMAQKDTRFEPSVLTVQVGETVSFPNLDPFFHNVFSYSKTKKFDLGRYPQGNSSVVTFDKPGLVNVFCDIHSSMRAYVHVLNTPYHAVSDEEGNFTINDIPPGNYTLHLWQENLSNYQIDLSITEDSTYIELTP